MGGQISLYNLIARLDMNKYCPFLLCPSPGELSVQFKKIGCKVLHHNIIRSKTANIFKIFFLIITLLKLLRNNNTDIVHADHPVDTFFMGICSRLLGIPLIWHIRVSEPSRFDRINYYLASKLICVSIAAKKRFLPFNHVKNKLLIINNGVDCSLFKPAAIRTKFRLGFNAEVKIITTVCQIIKEKGIYEFLEAANLICKKVNNCRFLLVGDGPVSIKEKICKIIEKEKLEEYIHILGYREDISDILNNSDLFVLASYIEGFPRAILEAMACGKPVVGTNVEGINEAVKHKATGLLVPPRNPEKLSHAILYLLENEKLLEKMGNAGRKRAERLFSISRNVEMINNVYDELIHGNEK